MLLSLSNAWLRGEYRQINPKAFLAVVGALLYFVTPLDALPDWLVGMGFVDDLAVLAWVLKTWSGELDAFRAWRAAQRPEVQADLERLPAPDSQRSCAGRAGRSTVLKAGAALFAQQQPLEFAIVA
ncbi:hypothetical protein D3C76_746980 [compost metagenome]